MENVFPAKWNDDICLFFFRNDIQFTTWVACIGFTLGFGGMLLKTWRVHKIFLNRTKKMVSP